MSPHKAMPEKMDRTEADRDSLWKELLDRYLRPFLAFFFPQVERDIDWSRPPEFLDKELQKIVRDSALGRRLADKLVKVWLSSGKEAWLLIHIEVQGRPESAFVERVYQYNYRIFDRYGREVISLALLTERKSPYSRVREVRRWGFEHSFRFPVVSLGSFRGEMARLEKDRNPFALVVLAHLKAQEARRPVDRARWKVRLVRLLFERGYRRRDIMELLRFIDWILVLPRELEEKVSARIERIERQSREKRMPYVTSWERLGIEKGLEQGREQGLERGLEQGLREAIELGLKLRFGKDGLRLLPRVRKLAGIARLRAFHRALLTASTVSALKARLERKSALAEER